MGFFSKRKAMEYPVFPEGDHEPVLRCSICTGEQTLCYRDRQTGKLHDLMLVRDPADLDGFCRQNGLDPETIKKVY